MAILGIGTALTALAQPAADGGPTGESGDPAVLPVTPKPAIDPARKTEAPVISEEPVKRGVNWGGLAWQSGLFLGVQHSYRLATEPGTREGLKGPFFKEYGQAVGNLHGWSDGDEFYVNYLGHPMQGAVAAYIWVQNDRDYRTTEFGKDPRYWKSRLRATAFSWAYSTQFEIGPLSEASIGKVQNYYPAQGFVDHAVTPMVGMGWMLAEDAIDRFIIKRFESKVRIPVLQMLVRGFLNPSRSFGNAMALRVPWDRDTRPGVWSGQLSSFLDSKKPMPIQAPLPEKLPKGDFGIPIVEVAPVYRQQFRAGRDSSYTCLGGGADASLNLNPSWQFLVDVGGCKILGLDNRWSGDSLDYFAGLRWTPRGSSRWSPYVQFLTGGVNITAERDRNGTYKETTAEVTTSNNFALRAGGGVDFRFAPGMAIRLANLEYTHTWISHRAFLPSNSGLSLATGLVIRYGAHGAISR